VNDPRNTDNAWVETTAVNYHDQSSNNAFQSIRLRAGDDAAAVKWVQVYKNLDLYASHSEILAKVGLCSYLVRFETAHLAW
jgi:ADP-ribose pyrophosphatase